MTCHSLEVEHHFSACRTLTPATKHQHDWWYSSLQPLFPSPHVVGGSDCCVPAPAPLARARPRRQLRLHQPGRTEGGARTVAAVASSTIRENSSAFTLARVSATAATAVAITAAAAAAANAASVVPAATATAAGDACTRNGAGQGDRGAGTVSLAPYAACSPPPSRATWGKQRATDCRCANYAAVLHVSCHVCNPAAQVVRICVSKRVSSTTWSGRPKRLVLTRG